MKDLGTKRVLALTFLSGAFFLAGRATAYDPSIYNSLSRSREALLAQKAHLQDAADDAKAKIDQLQRQLETINAYLTDTSNALNDVEQALARTQ